MPIQVVKVSNLFEIVKDFELKVNPNYNLVKSSDLLINKYGKKDMESYFKEDRIKMYMWFAPTIDLERLTLFIDCIDFFFINDDLNNSELIQLRDEKHEVILLNLKLGINFEPDCVFGEIAKE